MTKHYTYIQKNNGDTLSATEWNNLAQDVDAAVDAINNSAGGSSSSDPHIVFDERSESNPTGKSNLTIETTANDQYVDGSKTKGGKINIEPISDLQIKPGDDICVCSHHRADPTEVSMKVLDGNDNPVKLQLNAANIVLTTKDKNKTKEKDANGDDTANALYDDPTVMNVTVNSAKNTRGYLKVRAQAIDLRCEDNGGIALQPKGVDGDGHENKIKFEHNGGDGKEFGTFNTEHSSLFTNDYRFNKDGVVYAVTRGPLETTYKIDNDPTSGVKKIDYPTQSDDFKDIINQNTPHCNWESIILGGSIVNSSTAYLFNSYGPNLVQIPNNVDSYHYVGDSTFKDGLYYTIEDYITLLDTDDENVSQQFVILDNQDNVIEYWETTQQNWNILDIKSSLDYSCGIRFLSNGTTVNDILFVGKNKLNRICQYSINDIITLVQYFKDGGGGIDGPWANVY